MFFLAHPAFLLALPGWAALAVYLLRSRPRRVVVPYLKLWRVSEEPAGPKRAWRRPPAAILAMLAAVLLGIVAAAGPARRTAMIGRPVILLVDRGITLSARVGDSRRFIELAAINAPIIERLIGAAPAELRMVPGRESRQVRLDDWVDAVRQFGPTAVDTSLLVNDAVKAALQDPAAMVILISDVSVGVENARLVQIVPDAPATNVGIADFAVRAGPTTQATQAMVRLRNDSSLAEATLRVTGGDSLAVHLPPMGSSGNYFVNLASAEPVIQASVEPGGDIDGDDQAWVVRGRAWPKVVAPYPLPPAMERMMEVYAAHRPAGNEAIVSVLPLGNEMPDSPAMMVATESGPATQISGEVQVEAHELTAALDWNAALRDATMAEGPPGEAWQALVSVGGRAVFAVREQPHRQAWVGFNSPGWGSSPDFVVFFARVFDFVGEGSERYLSDRVGRLDSQWVAAAAVKSDDNGLWPGIYTRGSETKAVNADEVPIPRAQAMDWQGRLQSLAEVTRAGAFDLSWLLAVCAMLCVLIAAATWLA